MTSVLLTLTSILSNKKHPSSILSSYVLNTCYIPSFQLAQLEWSVVSDVVVSMGAVGIPEREDGGVTSSGSGWLPA